MRSPDDSCPSQSRARALVGKGGVGEAVADHHLATRQRRLDHLHQVVAAGRKGHQRLGQRVHGVVQQQGAQLFGQRRAAGLARERDRAALSRKAWAVRSMWLDLPAPSMPSKLRTMPCGSWDAVMQ
jgi:hypothetical protein